GATTVHELTLHTPLTIPADVHVRISTPDDNGHHDLTITSPAGLHATGILTTAALDPDDDLSTWPPTGAASVPVDDLYDRLADAGFGYGPVFQGLRAAWIDGDDVYAEIELPADADTTGYGLHPALLDAALHGLLLGSAPDDRGPRLPFAFQQVQLRRPGATALRVRLRRLGDDRVRVTASDADGTPVASIGSLTLRSSDLALPLAGPRYAVQWMPAGPAPTVDISGDVVVDVPTGELTDVVAGVLTEIQSFLTGGAAGRLVLVTRGAVATTGGEPVTDLAHAAVWGLARSAQSEHPDRIVVVDGDSESGRRSGESQVAIRDGKALVPRLMPVRDPVTTPVWDGTVLITGGTGTLGTLVARHLVQRHGVRSLLLASRRGVVTGLEDLDATIKAVACDVGDRDAVDALLAQVPEDQPLTAVVHLAGVLDDATVEQLTPERLTTVLRTKAIAARHLHEATRDRDLRAFVLFSSIAGVLGSPGQANYAAANAVLDALAQARHAEGLPATSIAWGMWAELSDMTRELGDGRPRMRAAGLRPLRTEVALALLDAAVGGARPVVAAADLDLAVWRNTDPDAVPVLLRNLRPGPARRTDRAGRGAEGGPGWAARVAALPKVEQERAVLDEVRSAVAQVLGHTAAEAVEPGQGFLDMGFDSLTALELRNLLGARTGIRLPATVIFDFPTPEALACRLRPDPEAARLALVTPVVAELDRLTAALAEQTADSRARSVLADRLQVFLDRLVGDSAETVELTTDEEMFAFIDNSLRPSDLAN
ncbi:SDR family NAD(P)-dependent oxidoreductase, partial [Micromonospora sp. KC207]|uniref:type I polyketide synthase n=1 Tax=Micromonospora sp. KC207 TaxID=2530377 RepID=UPI00104373C4